MKYELTRTIVAGAEREIARGDFDEVAEHYLRLNIKRYPNLTLRDTEGEEHFPFELTPKQIESLLPRHYFEWQICGRCHGDGTCLIDGLEGVAFTSEEFDEVFGEPEERQRYFSGGYDRPCPSCNATGKVLELDVGKLERHAPLLAKHRQEWLDDEYETRLMYKAERRMGA